MVYVFTAASYRILFFYTLQLPATQYDLHKLSGSGKPRIGMTGLKGSFNVKFIIPIF